MSERMTAEELARIEGKFEGYLEDYPASRYPADVYHDPDVLDALALVSEVKALRADLAEARASGLTPEQAARLDFAEEFNELAGGGA